MAKIDLDAARAARREAKKDEGPLEILFGGETFSLPAEVPFEAIEVMANVDTGPAQVRAIVDSILGADQRAAFWAVEPKPSIDDLNAFVDQVLTAYGLTAGES